jgi:hypothetical protein
MEKVKIQALQEMENPDLNKPASLFLSEEFRGYVEEKYMIGDKSILDDHGLMQMMYAVEWYDIPRSSYSDKVQFHPYLTNQDNDVIFYLKAQHRVEQTTTLALFSMVANRLLGNKPSWFSRRIFRWPLATAIGGLTTYLFSRVVLDPIFLGELDETGLSQRYFHLDLNVDMMKEDLKGMGVFMKGEHFSLESEQ